MPGGPALPTSAADAELLVRKLVEQGMLELPASELPYLLPHRLPAVLSALRTISQEVRCAYTPAHRRAG